MNRLEELLLRPPKQTYYPHDLGAYHSMVNGAKVKRSDFTIIVEESNQFSASFFSHQPKIEQCQSARPYSYQNKGNRYPKTTVIYLHTHHGSKIEGLYLKDTLMSLGLNFCIFDFSGYGNSSKNHVTIGFEESKDIGFVIEKLEQNYNQQQFILWGRSMGAVAGLMYLSEHQKDTKILCCVLDSPFSSLQKSICEIASKKVRLPEKVVSLFVYIFRKSIEHHLNFSSLELVPLMAEIKVPALFLASKTDKFIDCSHSQALYKAYGGYKQLHYIQRDHNEHRTHQQLNSAFEFIENCLIRENLMKNIKMPYKQKKTLKQIQPPISSHKLFSKVNPISILINKKKQHD